MACSAAPSQAQANPECPCRDQGLKWSEHIAPGESGLFGQLNGDQQVTRIDLLVRGMDPDNSHG